MSFWHVLREWSTDRRRGPLTICRTQSDYRDHLTSLWEAQFLFAWAKDDTTVGSTSAEQPEPPAPFSVWRNRATRKESPPLEWSLAFTPLFSKAIALAERTMQGRVLIALAELSNEPTTPRGDTVKPLSGNQRGLWRYRLGDYRLVYEPRQNSRMVVLVNFASRGEIYD